MVGNLVIYESAVFYNKQERWLCQFVRNREAHNRIRKQLVSFLQQKLLLTSLLDISRHFPRRILHKGLRLWVIEWSLPWKAFTPLHVMFMFAQQTLQQGVSTVPEGVSQGDTWPPGTALYPCQRDTCAPTPLWGPWAGCPPAPQLYWEEPGKLVLSGCDQGTSGHCSSGSPWHFFPVS